MPEADQQNQLDLLLSQIVYNRSYNALDNLHPLRGRLETDHDGSVAAFLESRLPALPVKIRGGIAFALAEHYLKTGDLLSLRALFASHDVEVQQSVLNGLWGEPYASPAMGPGIIALAVEGAQHPAPEVRTEAASVIQNQSRWGVDVTSTLDPLRRLLDDPAPRVRSQAAYAVGNVAQGLHRASQQAASALGIGAKGQYDLSPLIAPLVCNLRHEDYQVYMASAWALWQLSKGRRDIAPAIAELTHLLTSTEEYNEPRKRAAGALLHHARKSVENREDVRRHVAAVSLDTGRKEIARFLLQLAAPGEP